MSTSSNSIPHKRRSTAKGITAAQILQSLESTTVSHREPDRVPPGWYTTVQWRDDRQRGRNPTNAFLNRLVYAGWLETKQFRIITNGYLRLVRHFKKTNLYPYHIGFRSTNDVPEGHMSRLQLQKIHGLKERRMRERLNEWMDAGWIDAKELRIKVRGTARYVPHYFKTKKCPPCEGFLLPRC